LRRAHPLASESLTNPTLLQHIFWIWNIKEAYTKCLGLGLGFNFSRISVDFDALAKHLENYESESAHNPGLPSVAVCVDGQPVLGYEFTFFEVAIRGQTAEEIYQGAIARRFRTSGSEDQTISNDAGDISTGSDAVTQSRFIAKGRIKHGCQDPTPTMYNNSLLHSDSWLRLWDVKTLVQATDAFE